MKMTKKRALERWVKNEKENPGPTNERLMGKKNKVDISALIYEARKREHKRVPKKDLPLTEDTGE